MACGLRPRSTQVYFKTTTQTGSHCHFYCNKCKKMCKIWERTCKYINGEAYISPELLSVGGCRVNVGFVVRFVIKGLYWPSLCVCVYENWMMGWLPPAQVSAEDAVPPQWCCLLDRYLSQCLWLSPPKSSSLAISLRY